MTADEIKAQLDQIFIEEFEVDAAALVPEANLGEHLGIDSLDIVDLIVSIEKKFDCRIEEEEARSMTTLGDIHAYIERRLAAVQRSGS